MKKNIALLIIDVQASMFAGDEPVHKGEALLEKVKLLIDRARTSGIPIIYVQHYSKDNGHPLELGTAGWEIHKDIAPEKEDTIIKKTTPDSFNRTTLNFELDKMGIHKLVICGLQTDFCVDTTCRRAFSLGYDVVLAEDTHSTWGSGSLTAEQIIDHHNLMLSNWFVELEPASTINFKEL